MGYQGSLAEDLPHRGQFVGKEIRIWSGDQPPLDCGRVSAITAATDARFLTVAPVFCGAWAACDGFRRARTCHHLSRLLSAAGHES